MKKTILLTLIILSSLTVVKADELPKTAEANVNVKLNPIQTLVVNSTQTNIDLEYKTIENYNDGVRLLQKDHLKVYSTGGFAVKVMSVENDIKRVNGPETISSSTITVTASNGSTNSLESNYNTISLTSTSEDNLISSSTGGVDRNFNITYAGIGANGYVNSYFKDESPTVYSATVTYTIVAI